jgi:hypothetical protein
VEVGDLEFLKAHTDRPVKMTVPGPFTMTQQAQNDHYPDLESAAMAYAAAVNAEIKDLHAAGADVVQIDEPYLQARPEQARGYGVQAIDRALQGIEGETALHICFGYGHIVKDKPEGYSFLEELDGCAATQISIETAQPDLDLAILRRLPSKTIILGWSTGRDAGCRCGQGPGRARARAARAAGHRPGLRDEVPATRNGLCQARGDDGRRSRRARRAFPLSIRSIRRPRPRIYGSHPSRALRSAGEDGCPVVPDADDRSAARRCLL